MTTTSTHSTVLIVGGGGMGLSSAWRVAKRGVDVRVLEQFPFLHKRGSSHTEHRIIRRTYNDDIYSRLMVAAYDYWSELEQDSGQKLKYLIGGVDFGPADDPTLTDLIRVSKEIGIPLDVLTPAEAKKRFPQFNLPDNFLLTFCPENGFLAVDDCMKAKLDQARRYGAILQDEEQVLEIIPRDHGAEVRTDKATYTCDKLIVTAGPYVNNLMQQMGLDFGYTIELNQAHWFEVKHPELFVPGTFPVFIVRYDASSIGGMYGFPTFRNPGIKVSIHHSNNYIDIKDYDLQPRENTTERVLEFVREFIPDVTGKVLNLGACPYDFPTDEHFTISLHPRHKDIAMANMAGHGYKFASVVGEILAQLALDGKSSFDLTGFDVNRFFDPGVPHRPAIHVDIMRPKS
ncbi:MAG: N-methyl-L-tryptophan oxidase [Anaerolineae bacterium]|nr:N-methyl-L-tryptophan oxidase [Anaerolineae bacterium]